jgi:hypothetical protein
MASLRNRELRPTAFTAFPIVLHFVALFNLVFDASGSHVDRSRNRFAQVYQRMRVSATRLSDSTSSTE